MGRKKKFKVRNMEDRISKLPDEILVSILSCLSLKEAHSTSILSSRWRHLCSFNTILDFDANKCLITSHNPTDYSKVPSSRYIEWVDSIVEQHRAAKIERFRIKFGNYHKRRVIDKWIRFAMMRGVEVLEVNLSTVYQIPRYELNKALGVTGFATFKSLCEEYNGFKFLKAVDFNRVDVDQHTVEYLINNCPVLELVAVCDSSALINLRVVGDAIALKHLTIKQCGNLKCIEIRDANIVSFAYGGQMKKLLLRNLPRLVEVSFPRMPGVFGRDRRIDFSYLSCCLSQLETLKIDDTVTWGKSDPVIPPLPNLKCLELALNEESDNALVQLSLYIKQAPSLHSLAIKLQLVAFCASKSRLFAKKAAARFCHDGLKVVKFVGYCGFSCQLELIEYVMETASNLEKVIFDPYNPFSFEDDKRNKNLDLHLRMSRGDARKLKEKLPAILDVVCL